MDIRIKYDPHNKQRLAHMAPQRYILYGGSMRSGKSVWLVNETISLLVDFPHNRGFLGRWENTSFQRTTYLTLLEYLPQDLIRNHNKTKQFIELINGSTLLYGGLKSSGAVDKKIIDNIKSMDLGFFALDEASEIPEELYLVFVSRVGGGFLEKLKRENKWTKPIYYKGLLTSNPEPGWLRSRFIDKSLPDHKFIQALPSDNPYLPSNYVKDLRKIYPSHWVKRYLEGDWDAFEGNDYLIPYRYILDAINRKLDGTGEISFGVDVAERGGDKTVIYMREGAVAKLLFSEPKTELMEIVGMIHEFSDEYAPDAPLNIDAIGIGAGVCSRLEELDKNVVRIIGGESVEANSDGTKFFNKRSKLFWDLKEKFIHNEISIEDDDDLKSQLSSMKFEHQSDRTVRVEGKKQMRKRGLSSPDKADALCYCFAQEDAQPQIYLL